jgi:hypothetical protein
MPQTYIHITHHVYPNGTLIPPGNWGKRVRADGMRHQFAVKDAALEEARLRIRPGAPSRLDSAFAFLSVQEAQSFVMVHQEWRQRFAYEVAVHDPEAASWETDWRLTEPMGPIRHDWADAYWMDKPARDAALDAMGYVSAALGRELLTLSPLVVVQQINLGI